MKSMFSRLIGCLLAAWLFSPTVAVACSVCFGKSESSLAQGMKWGVFVLGATVVGVLGGIAAFFVYLSKRNRASQAQAAQTTAVTTTDTAP